MSTENAAIAQSRAATLNSFSVLRTGATGSEDESAKLRGVISRLMQSGDTAGAVSRVARNDASARVLVGVTDAALCLTVKDRRGGTSSTGCTDPGDAGDARKPLTSVDFVGPDTWRATALLPDGISEVRIANRDGHRSIPVSNNIATATIPGGDTTLSWTTAAGEAHSLTVHAS